MNIEHKRWITPQELSEYIGLSLGHIRNQLARGGIYPSCKIGGSWRIDRHKLDEMLEARITPVVQEQVESWEV